MHGFSVFGTVVHPKKKKKVIFASNSCVWNLGEPDQN